MARPGAFVIRLLRHDCHEITLNSFFIGGPIGYCESTERKAGVRAVYRVHDPAPDLRCREVSTGRRRKCGRNRPARDASSQGRREELLAVDDLHHAVGASAIREIDAVTLDPCRYRPMY